MNNNRIEEIKNRLQAATLGKWQIVNEDDEDICIISKQNEKEIYICQTTYDGQSCTQEHNVQADSEFIANAKEDIVFLLSLIL